MQCKVISDLTFWILFGLAASQSARPTYSSCDIPDEYETQLNIIPIPRSRKVEHGQTIYVLCRTSGHTFMNHMYSVRFSLVIFEIWIYI